MAATLPSAVTMQQENYELSEVSPSVSPLGWLCIGRPRITPPQLANGQERRPNRAAASSGEVSTAAESNSLRSPPWSFKQFWADNVNCVVDFDKCRDHLGK